MSGGCEAEPCQDERDCLASRAEAAELAVPGAGRAGLLPRGAGDLDTATIGESTTTWRCVLEVLRRETHGLLRVQESGKSF